MRASLSTLLVPITVLMTGLLSGCAATVSLAPAATYAADPGCAEVSVRLPDELDGAPSRVTDAQGTAAWGEPASVLLRCGVEPPGPTTDRCISISGVDWVETQPGDDPDVFDYTTYGRVPATTVTIDTAAASSTNVLTDLSSVVAVLPAERGCVGANDIEIPESTPAP